MASLLWEGSTITQLTQALVFTLLSPPSCSPPPSYPVVQSETPAPSFSRVLIKQWMGAIPYLAGHLPCAWGMLPVVKAECHVWVSRARNLNYLSEGNFITTPWNAAKALELLPTKGSAMLPFLNQFWAVLERCCHMLLSLAACSPPVLLPVLLLYSPLTEAMPGPCSLLAWTLAWLSQHQHDPSVSLLLCISI